MLESGSCVPGANPATWYVPDTTAFRLELPPTDLRRFVRNYFLYDTRGGGTGVGTSWFLPSWPVITIHLTQQTVVARIGRRTYDPVPDTSLYGATTRPIEVTSSGGLTVGMTVTPLGWSRLFPSPAAQVSDRIVPLETLMSNHAISALVDQLRKADLGTDLSRILDQFVNERLSPPTKHEEAIGAIANLIDDGRILDTTTACEHLQMQQQTVRKICVRYFGFPLKVLLTRERFTRAIIKLMLFGYIPKQLADTFGYYDQSHLLKDAYRFIETTPRRFLKRDHRYLLTAIRAYRDLYAITKSEREASST